MPQSQGSVKNIHFSSQKDSNSCQQQPELKSVSVNWPPIALSSLIGRLVKVYNSCKQDFLYSIDSFIPSELTNRLLSSSLDIFRLISGMNLKPGPAFCRKKFLIRRRNPLKKFSDTSKIAFNGKEKKNSGPQLEKYFFPTMAVSSRS